MTIGLSKMSNKMTTAPSRKKGIQAYKENPFWESTEVKIGSKKISVSGGMHVSDDGESIAHSGVHVVREVDENEFMKVYTKNIKSIFDLKPSTQRVLQYLLTELQKTPNADAVYLAWIGAEEYFSEQDLNVSRSSFQRSMKELLNKGFLAESTKPSMFWFNPNLFFNGNRMSFVHEYRKKITAPLVGDAHLQRDAFNGD
jgi:predicted transcriptional regulator